MSNVPTQEQLLKEEAEISKILFEDAWKHYNRLRDEIENRPPEHIDSQLQRVKTFKTRSEEAEKAYQNYVSQIPEENSRDRHGLADTEEQ